MRINSYKLRVILVYFQFSRVSFVGMKHRGRNFMSRLISIHSKTSRGEHEKPDFLSFPPGKYVFPNTRFVAFKVSKILLVDLRQIADKTLSTYPLTSFHLIGCFYPFRRHVKTLLFKRKRR